MKFKLEDYLKVVIPYLSSELVSPEALSNIRSLTKILPPFPFSILECRLGEEQPRVDLEVGLFCNNFTLPETFMTHPKWQAFQHIYHECSESKYFLYQKVKDIWLEFDVDKQPLQLPVPCIFLALNQENNSTPQELIEIVNRLLNYRVSSIFASSLALTMNCLPSNSHITYIGAMLSRSDKAIRIVTSEIRPEQLPEYLERIGWMYSIDKLQSVISDLSAFVDYICLSFDVGESILPRIGLECHLSKMPKYETRWQLFLDYLVKNRLCTVPKRNAILDWPGFCQEKSHPELWPENLKWGDSFLGTKALSIFARKISHIKIVYEHDSLVEAKAYLWFGHTWLDSRLVRQELALSTSA
ncbi:hypothetical protein [Nostoc sp. UHCC 0870]|uniref:hypothetical protein n=1 Tax=Nostoc sp. UHCC 0870 TaxID=2914041 RepID=UPI001EE103C4|nr:hypothetical protein [Nostoc sp. UHCC 0870]UKO96709.1 hypothetical protein L6494_19115 [Nostoc sp. UHCC 0870]